jgi:hypothetical protein
MLAAMGPGTDGAGVDPLCRRPAQVHPHASRVGALLGGSPFEVSSVRPYSPTADVEALLEEIDRDPTAIFWG